MSLSNFNNVFVMTNILAIDTSSPRCATALMTDDLFIKRISDAERQSAQRVLPMIAELLEEAGIKLSELSAIAVMSGPGSFTGLRIGIGVTQGLSMALSIPVIALSSLAVTAVAAIREASCQQVLVCETARNGEVYFAAYLKSKRLGVELIGSEQLSNPESIQLSYTLGEFEQWSPVGNGWASREEIQSALECKLHEGVILPGVSIEDLCELAKLRIAAGETISADQLKPNYVKEQLDYS